MDRQLDLAAPNRLLDDVLDLPVCFMDTLRKGANAAAGLEHLEHVVFDQHSKPFESLRCVFIAIVHLTV